LTSALDGGEWSATYHAEKEMKGSGGKTPYIFFTSALDGD